MAEIFKFPGPGEFHEKKYKVKPPGWISPENIGKELPFNKEAQEAHRLKQSKKAMPETAPLKTEGDEVVYPETDEEIGKMIAIENIDLYHKIFRLKKEGGGWPTKDFESRFKGLGGIKDLKSLNKELKSMVEDFLQNKGA